MDLFFLCLLFFLDIYNMLKTKTIGNLQAIEDRKSNLEILSKLDFPMTPCVTSLPREIPSKVNGIPELEFKYI